MNIKFIGITIGLWFLFMVLAIINAGIRNSVYKPIVGDLAAHQISSIIFMIIILIVTSIILRFTNLVLTDTEAIFMGILWLIATIAFEFIAGHYVFGNSWDKLFTDYNLLQGRIWGLVLSVVFIAPYITNKLREMF